jgi:hypothetical protein
MNKYKAYSGNWLLYVFIFDIPYDELAEFEIWGEFWTCNNAPIQGEWQVTFAISE